MKRSATASGPAIAAAAFAATFAAEAAQAAETIRYGYDARGRLVTVVREGAASAVTTRYTHDRADNRTAKTTTAP